MRTHLIFILVLLTAFVCCEDNSKNELPNFGNKSDSAFQRISEDFIAKFLNWNPELAVTLGLHQFDGISSNYSRASLDSQLTALKGFDQQLGLLNTAALSLQVYYDYRILQLAIKNNIFNLRDLKTYASNPMDYAQALDVSIYVKRNFAPIEERVRSIINIERTTPDLFKYAKENLSDSLARPYIELAIEIAKGTAAFLGKDLVTALKEVKNDSLMTVFRSANKNAIRQVNSFAEYLKNEKLPKANNHYALGVEKYKKMLLYQEDITLTPEEILRIGLKELKKEQDAFDSAAKIIDPNRKPIDVYHQIQMEHPSADSLISDVRKNVESIRQFLLEKKIISIPSEVNVEVKETPEFERATSTASMDIPGPFEKKANEAYYYITPVDSSWSKRQKEDWLAQFNLYAGDITTIHEVYPGHYIQFLHLNYSSATTIEKIFGCTTFIEGWAHYTEKMMVDEGYGNNGDGIRAAKYRITQSGDALLRLCRLCVSVKTHCQNMNVDEATKFFMDNWHEGDKPSRQEALRGTFDPGYLFYTIGKLEILKLRDDYRKQEGSNFSLKKFHNLILEYGMPPICLLRERILKDKSIWDKIL